MKLKFLVTAITILIISSCGKNNYKTNPQFKIKSLNGNVIPLGSTVVVSLEVTDKEGDMSEGQFIYYPTLLNKRRLAVNIPNYIPITEPIPKFPDNSKSEIELRVPRTALYKDINSRPGEDKNDTISIRIVVADRAGNKSDTSVTEPIILLGQ